MFAAIASGNPLQLSEEVPNSNGLQHTLVLSSTKPKHYSHITLFILPNVTFPDEFIAIIYFKMGENEDFRLFGYLSNEKPSAIFKVRIPGVSSFAPGDSEDGLGEIDMEETSVGGDSIGGDIMGVGNMSNLSQLIIGISIEPREEGMRRVGMWREEQGGLMSRDRVGTSLALTRNMKNGGVMTAGQLAKMYPRLTQDLAGKIVQHAYNYLSGFLDGDGNVSIKRFDTWWDKFKKRLANDATFLDEVTGE